MGSSIHPAIQKGACQGGLGGAPEHQAEEEDLAPEGCAGRIPLQGDKAITKVKRTSSPPSQSVVKGRVCTGRCLSADVLYVGHLSNLWTAVGVNSLGHREYRVDFSPLLLIPL